MNDAANDKDDSKKADISAYLATPRKKRKNFVVIAVGQGVERATGDKIEAFVKKTYPHLAVSKPRDMKELSRQFSRNISLLVVDDQFGDLPTIMDSISSLKIRTKKDISPVVFLTQDPASLVDVYQKKLMAYQESDDYCDTKKMTVSQILGRIKFGIEHKNRRKSRRYNVSIPISFFHLTKDKKFSGKLVDISMHGALINADDLDHFNLSDQLKLSLPVHGLLGPGQGEFVHFTCRVRRVFVGGNSAGVSFEHLSEKQEHCLTKLLTTIAREDLVR